MCITSANSRGTNLVILAFRMVAPQRLAYGNEVENSEVFVDIDGPCEILLELMW